MIAYRKLVRDRIPEIIIGSGRRCVVRTLDDDAQYLFALKEKLAEEADEVRGVHPGDNDALRGELVDVLEVVDAIAAAAEISLYDIFAAKHRKRQERGGFAARTLLIEAE